MRLILRRSTLFSFARVLFLPVAARFDGSKSNRHQVVGRNRRDFRSRRVCQCGGVQNRAKQLGDLGLAVFGFGKFKTAIKWECKPKAAALGKLPGTAQLNSRGTLVTPGGQFGYGDGAKLKKWLDDVQVGGGLPGQRKTLFGLSGKQLEEVKKDLSSTVAFSTKGLHPEQAIEKIRTQLKTPLTIDRAIEKAIAADDPVRDEFVGLSAGTALAAIARPAGGVVVPRTGAKGVELAIDAPQTNGEMWPIGWPPEEKDEANVVPTLYQYTDVEIDGVTAEEAIDAIQGRLKTPLVWDYNNMVRGRVDLKKTVKVKAGKTYYRRILDQVLYQAGLKCEVRTDDAGKPLLWITTL